ncbi:MAG: DUF2752 domain-containing protein [Salinibacter sp.]
MLSQWTRSIAQWMRRVPREALFWSAALGAVAAIDPQSGGGINLCLIELLGLPCPGDGLGRAIAHLARGEVASSWAAHPLAGPAVLGITAHIVRLCIHSPPTHALPATGS